MKKTKTGLRAVIFLAIAAILFCGVNYMVRPVWSNVNNSYESTECLYGEPEDTIETLFLGTSVMMQGVSPMELYENYGICAYNLAQSNQPAMVSYYWLQEAYRLNPDTLDTVVFEVTSLVRADREDAWYQRDLSAMRFSGVKLRAARQFGIKNLNRDDMPFTEYVETEINGIAQILLPVITFHDRWQELGAQDLLKAWYTGDYYNRGFVLTVDSEIDAEDDLTSINFPVYRLNESADPVRLRSMSSRYFRKIVRFCRDHDIQLILLKTPVNEGWSSEKHNAVQEQADHYKVDFLDYNFAPLIDDMDYNPGSDSRDGMHLNYSGASKLTEDIGRFLITECDNRDVRGEEIYAFMNEEMVMYSRNTQDYSAFTDPANYLDYMTQNENHMVFISVEDDAAGALTDEQRKAFATIGLEELADLEYGDSYLAIFDAGGGGSLTENRKSSEASNAVEDFGIPITYSGSTRNGTKYTIVSGGQDMGQISSIEIDGEEYSEGKQGLNIAVWDKRTCAIVDQVVFDTSESSECDPRSTAELLAIEETEQTAYNDMPDRAQKLFSLNQMWEDYKRVNDNEL